VRQRAGAIAQQSRAATGVIVQKLDENDGIKDVALVPEIDEAASASGSGGGGGVAETLRGGGAGGRAVDGTGGEHGELKAEDVEDPLKDLRDPETGGLFKWPSTYLRDLLYPGARKEKWEKST